VALHGANALDEVRPHARHDRAAENVAVASENYFVVACSTRSAPRRKRRLVAPGVAVVLSQT
jgi:hypothetical protein